MYSISTTIMIQLIDKPIDCKVRNYVGNCLIVQIILLSKKAIHNCSFIFQLML